jgi:hypothetical protein
MPNGTGKSTIIELIGAALTKSTFNDNPSTIRSFAAIGNVSLGNFALHLHIDEAGKKNDLTILMRFDFEKGLVRYFTKKDVSSGLEEGFNPPSSISAFLDPRCVEVFVFKGDKADHLLDRSRDDAKRAIEAFFGISRIGDLILKLDQIMNSASIPGPQTDKGLTQRQNVLKKWVLRRDFVLNHLQRQEHKLSEVEIEYRSLKSSVERIYTGNADREKKIQEFESEASNCERQMTLLSSSLMQNFRNPFYASSVLAQKMKELKSNLDALKLPGTSGEFFRELADTEPCCICDRTMDADAKQAILRNIDRFLSDEHITVVNGIKRDIDTYTQKAEMARSSEIKDKKVRLADELAELSAKLAAIRQNQARYLLKIKEESSEAEKELLSRYERIVENRKVIIDQVEEIMKPYLDRVEKASSATPDDVWNLDAINKVIGLREEEVAQIKGNVDEFRRKELLKAILKQACERATGRISERIKVVSNSKLQAILPKGTKLEISAVDRNISIGFGSHEQAAGSGGQNVAVAYSFASAILEESGAEFPLIVDHPVTALQESARGVLGRTLPKVCNQFIGFVIDTEKEGFLPALKQTQKQSGSKLDTITIFRNIKGNESLVEQLPKSKEKFTLTPESVICTDGEFFEAFRSLQVN